MCVLTTLTNTENIMAEYITKVEPVKSKCPVCLEYFTGYLKEDGKLVTYFCSLECKLYYDRTLRPRKLKNILNRIGN